MKEGKSMNKSNEKFISILLIGIMLFSLVGCAPKSESPLDDNTLEEDTTNQEVVEQIEPISIGVLKGPTGMGMVKLMEDDAKLETPKYEISAYGSPDELVGKIINKEVDIAALPTNLASVIYNKTQGEISLIAINTLGVLYVVDTTNSVESILDLKGKKVSASGKGTVVEYAFSYLLRSNGLDPDKDVEVDYSLSHEELATAVATGDAEIALLPQPHVTTALMKNENARIAIDLTKEWDTLDTDSQLAMGCLVANKTFLNDNKEQIIEFLDVYSQSVGWVNENPELAGEWIEKYGILGNKTVATKAIPNSSIVFIEGKEAKTILEGFYSVLFEQNPKALGGAMPDDAFYFER